MSLNRVVIDTESVTGIYLWVFFEWFPELLRANRQRRIITSISCLCMFIAFAVFGLSAVLGKTQWLGLDSLKAYLIAGFSMVLFASLGLSLMIAASPTSQSPLNESSTNSGIIYDHGTSELVPIRKERLRLKQKIAQERRSDIFDAIQLNLTQLEEYYVINKSQARRSFAASLFAIIAGLLVITITLILPSISSQTISSRDYFGGASGIILQFIGGAYFYLYNRSLKQVNFFFSRLSITQDTMLAIALCDRLAESEIRSEMLKQIISALLSKDRSLIDIDSAVPDRSIKKGHPKRLAAPIHQAL